ncbi:MAG: PEP-CTERM sorting domain-containing protein [Chthoniobacterales bacterium]
MKKSTKLFLSICSICTLAGLAQASTTDLRGLPGNFDQTTFGQPNTTFYAQSVVADSTVFNSATLQLIATAGDINFNFLITGARADGGGGLGFAPDLSNILYNSGELTAGSGNPLTDFTINPNVPVANGQLLFLVVESLSYPGSGSGAVEATAFNGPTDLYPPGEFVFINSNPGDTYATINALPWAHRSVNNEDLAFAVTFSSVPEPTTNALLGLAAASFVWVAFRRRRRA